MAHGYEDYGGRAAKKIVHSIYDVGELAVRLDGTLSIDRLGEVILAENFNYGLGRVSVGSFGATGYVKIVSTNWRSKGWALDMHAGLDDDRSAYCYAYTAYWFQTRFGLEFWYKPDVDIEYIEATIAIFTGEYLYTFRCKIDVENNILYLEDAVGGNVVIDNNFVIEESFPFFYCFKLVVDTETAKYVRITTTNTIYDISAYSVLPDIDASAAKIRSEVYLKGKALGDGRIYLDDIIITQNEA